MKDIYNDEYLPSIIKTGRIILSISAVVFFVPFLATWFIYGIQPRWDAILPGVVAWSLMNAPWWLSEPISYFPVLGVAGTFISFLSGNGSNMRMPCAVASQKAAGVLPGTIQGSVISTIGISVSVFVNLAILIAGVLAGQAALAALSPSITAALNFLLPALFGCVFANFLMNNKRSGGVAIGLAVGFLVAYDNGLKVYVFSIFKMLVPIFGTMFAAYFFAKHDGAAETKSQKS